MLVKVSQASLPSDLINEATTENNLNTLFLVSITTLATSLNILNN